MKKIISLLLVLTIVFSLVILIEENQVEAAQVAGLESGRIYNLKNAGSGKYLNVHSGIDANGTNVYQLTKDGSNGQKFMLFYKASNDTYKFKAMCSNSGRVLDITRSGGPVVSGANVKIWADTDPTSQDFKIVHVGGGKYKIVPLANTSVALTVKGDSNGSSSGTSSTSAGNVFVENYKSDTNSDQKYQHWYFEEVNPGSAIGITSGEIYYIRNKRSGKYLDIYRNQTADHTPVQQYSIGYGLSLQWKVVYAGGGYYRIYSMLDQSKYLDGTSNPVNGSQVQIHSSDGSAEQLWKIIPNYDGSDNYSTSYRIACKKNEFSMNLAVQGASFDNNARVITHEYGYASNDEWYFDKQIEVGYTYQNTSYEPGCTVYNKHSNNIKNYVYNIRDSLKDTVYNRFLYEDKNSWSNDLKNAAVVSTTYSNIDNVDLMIATGHGYLKGRSYIGCGTPSYNSLHFGTTNSTASHVTGNGMVANANFTTYDNRYFGYGNAKSKWLVMYSCNFLNYEYDPAVFNMLKNGGRMVLGYATRVFCDAREGQEFADKIKKGQKISDAYFDSAIKYQNTGPNFVLSGSAGRRKVAILHYYDAYEDTMDDTIYVQKDVGRYYKHVLTYIEVNTSWPHYDI